MTDLNTRFDLDAELSGATRILGSISWLDSKYQRIASVDNFRGESPVPGPVAIVSFYSPHGFIGGDRVYLHGNGQKVDGLFEVIEHPVEEHRSLHFLVSLKINDGDGVAGGEARRKIDWDVQNPQHIDPDKAAELKSLQILLLEALSEVDGDAYRRAMIPTLKQLAVIGGNGEFVQDLDNLATKYNLNLAEPPTAQENQPQQIDDSTLSRLESITLRKNAATIEICCGMPRGNVLNARYYPNLAGWAEKAAGHIDRLMDSLRTPTNAGNEPPTEAPPMDPPASTLSTQPEQPRPRKKDLKRLNTGTPTISSELEPSSPE
jgi:hypothetical protein